MNFFFFSWVFLFIPFSEKKSAVQYTIKVWGQEIRHPQTKESNQYEQKVVI
jgi:hypothetical protein